MIRAHQPGSEPIDIPETIPNPVVVPKPTPTPTEPTPKEPVRIPAEGSLEPIGAKKLGQPVPLSNLVSERKSGRSQAAQANRPGRCSLSSALEYGRSVPRCRS